MKMYESKKIEIENKTIRGAMGKISFVLERPQEKNILPMVIMMHGLTSEKNNKLFLKISKELVKAGFSSLRFDFNGHGKSEGKLLQMTISNEIEDAKVIMEYVLDNSLASEIIFLGHSQGGVIASILAGEYGFNIIKGLILLAPAVLIPDMLRQGNLFGNKFNPKHPPAMLKVRKEQYVGNNYIENGMCLDIYDTALKYSGPVCIIQGMNDVAVPYIYSKLYSERYRCSELYLLKGLNHNFEPDPYVVINIIIDFINRM